MKKIISLLLIGFMSTFGNARLHACEKCVKQCKNTIKACEDFIKECQTNLTAAQKLHKECPKDKAITSRLIKRCKVSIVFCNWCKASCENYITIRDNIARYECISYCKKCIGKNRKLIDYCKYNAPKIKACKNVKASASGATHLSLVEACKSTMEEGKACNASCQSTIERLKDCKER